MINVSIIGSTGYVGLELVRILSQHPQVALKNLVSKSYIGKSYSDVYPNMTGICDIKCIDLDTAKIIDESDIVITALPHDASREIIPILIDSNVRVIDHSGHFRFRDVLAYEKWYHAYHGMEALNEMAVYGMPELYREKLRSARLVGNPGCYPTCTVLPLVPLIKENIIDCDSIVVNAASGVSGAGRQAKTDYSFCETDNNYKAYGVSTHRHTGEIEQELSIIANNDIKISFIPHLAPLKRGMLATTYAKLDKKATTKELLDICRDYYKNEAFMRILPEGVLPEVKLVAGSNYLDMGLVVDERTNSVTVISAIDNLMKGAAGQAVQVLNIMTGIEENTALTNAPIYL